jgi:RNA polymerase sigma-70 factor (ECF subfamily)
MEAVMETYLTRSNSKTSFSEIAETHLDDVFGYLIYLTKDRQLAEELAAETFEKALRRFNKFDPSRASAKTWLCQIARSTMLDHFRSQERRNKKQRLLEANYSDRHEERIFEGIDPTLSAALATLTGAEREVIALRILLELEASEAATVLGINPGALATRLSRALDKLRKEMNHE